MRINKTTVTVEPIEASKTLEKRGGAEKAEPKNRSFSRAKCSRNSKTLSIFALKPVGQLQTVRLARFIWMLLGVVISLHISGCGSQSTKTANTTEASNSADLSLLPYGNFFFSGRNSTKKSSTIRSSSINSEVMMKPILGLVDYNANAPDPYNPNGDRSLDFSTLWADHQKGENFPGGEHLGCHPGVDILVPSGTEIRSSCDGVVIKAVRPAATETYSCSSGDGGWGGYIVIACNQPKVYVTYAHLREIYPRIKEVTIPFKLVTVTINEPMGRTGGDSQGKCNPGSNSKNSNVRLNKEEDQWHGHSTGSHLHFQIDKSFSKDSICTNRPYYPLTPLGVNGVEGCNVDECTENPLVFVQSRIQKNQPPYSPTLSFPEDWSKGNSENITLNWKLNGDPEGDTIGSYLAIISWDGSKWQMDKPVWLEDMGNNTSKNLNFPSNNWFAWSVFSVNWGKNSEPWYTQSRWHIFNVK